jgi:hypothetical protein
LEDLVVRIDAPLLYQFEIELLSQLIFYNYNAELTLPPDREFKLEIPCRQSDWQPSMMAQIYSPSLCLISSVVHLCIHEFETNECRRDDIENIQWLELLQSFTAVKALILYLPIPRYYNTNHARAGRVRRGKGDCRVTCASESFLEEPRPSGLVQEFIGKFVAA